MNSTDTALDRQDRMARDYGVQETGMPVGPEYHATVDHSTEWTLAEISRRGGRITRVRLFHEQGRFDVSYIHGFVPGVGNVHVNLCHMTSAGFGIPRRAFKGEMIKWAQAERVFAKGLGLLDESNWSILW